MWRLTSNPLRSLEAGEVSVALHTVSLDPGMKGWITNKRSYMPPVKPGAVMRAFGVGEIMESRAEGLAIGDWVTGFTGVQTHGVYKAAQLSKIDCSLASPEKFLSGLGMTGYTGYFGMSDLGKPHRIRHRCGVCGLRRGGLHCCAGRKACRSTGHWYRRWACKGSLFDRYAGP